MITLLDVSRHHMVGRAPKVILNRVSHSFGRGEKVGVLALGGGGKSTLARLLCGTERPDGGTILRQGKISWPLGMTHGFHPDLSPAANISCLASILGLDPAFSVEYCRRFADIGRFFDAPLRTASPGMRARLAFAFSMVDRPDTYVSDEVVGAGDHIFRDRCEAVLRERLETAGLILISRTPRLLDRFCDRFLALHAGKLIPCETAAEAADILNYAVGYGDTFAAEVRNE